MSWSFQCAKQIQWSRKYHWRGNNGKWLSWLHYELSRYLHVFVDNVGNSAACMPFQMTLVGLKCHVSHLTWALNIILWWQAARLGENYRWVSRWAQVQDLAPHLWASSGASTRPSDQQAALVPCWQTACSAEAWRSVHFLTPSPELGIFF